MHIPKISLAKLNNPIVAGATAIGTGALATVVADETASKGDWANPVIYSQAVMLTMAGAGLASGFMFAKGMGASKAARVMMDIPIPGSKGSKVHDAALAAAKLNRDDAFGKAMLLNATATGIFAGGVMGINLSHSVMEKPSATMHVKLEQTFNAAKSAGDTADTFFNAAGNAIKDGWNTVLNGGK